VPASDREHAKKATKRQWQKEKELSIRDAEERETKRRKLEKENEQRQRNEEKEKRQQQRGQRGQERDNAKAERERKRAEKEDEKAAKEAVRKELAEAKKREAAKQLAWESSRAKEIFDGLTKPVEPGERVFSDTLAFFQALLSKAHGEADRQSTTNITRFFRDHGAEIVTSIFDYMPAIEEEVLSLRTKERLAKLEQEGEKIQRLLSRRSDITLTQLLEGFTIDGLARQLEEEAPNVWECLSAVVSNGKDGTDRVCHEKIDHVIKLMREHRS
jgi:hypothetical protein